MSTSGKTGDDRQVRMARMSLPIEDMKEHYTAVVIGSGYGGGIAASRLSRAGQSVCLLERGREMHPGEYPETASGTRRRSWWRARTTPPRR